MLLCAGRESPFPGEDTPCDGLVASSSGLLAMKFPSSLHAHAALTPSSIADLDYAFMDEGVACICSSVVCCMEAAGLDEDLGELAALAATRTGGE